MTASSLLKNCFFILLAAYVMLAGGCATSPAPTPAAVRQKAAPEAASTVPAQQDYVIQAGDQLDIKSFYTPELNAQVTVRPDGNISLPLVDDVQAAGLTPAQLDQTLTSKYTVEFKDPDLTVVVTSFAGRQIYVGGEVNTEGVIALTAGMTPLQAVVVAGGFKETAQPESTLIIRKGPRNEPLPIRVNLHDAIYGKKGQADFLLQPQDVIYVPKTTIARANKFVNQYIEQLLLFRGISFGFNYGLTNNQ